MGRVRAFVVASHAAPTVVVTLTMTVFAWSIGWRGWPLAVVCVALLVGQLSIGWSNDAHDAAFDARASRESKPTVTSAVTPRALWIAACIALALSSGLSWAVAGLVGGSFHVFTLIWGWLYNVALSRTWWSWLPYALAFGAIPLFLYVGLDGQMGPWWTVAVFAIVAVSVHIANALPDLDSDRALGLDGFVIRLGARRSAQLCWLLLGLGTGLLVTVSIMNSSGPLVPAVLIAGYLGAIAYGTLSPRRSAMFLALLVVVLLDVITLITSPAL